MKNKWFPALNYNRHGIWRISPNEEIVWFGPDNPEGIPSGWKAKSFEDLKTMDESEALILIEKWRRLKESK